jgi:outer membrane receptor for ferrienterochelin and colicins
MNVTKKFNSGLEVYAGIKNLANFLPKNPIMRWYDPFDKKVQDSKENPNGYTFDTTYSYAPMQGRKIVVGIRYNLK